MAIAHHTTTPDRKIMQCVDSTIPLDKTQKIRPCCRYIALYDQS